MFICTRLSKQTQYADARLSGEQQACAQRNGGIAPCLRRIAWPQDQVGKGDGTKTWSQLATVGRRAGFRGCRSRVRRGAWRCVSSRKLPTV